MKRLLLAFWNKLFRHPRDSSRDDFPGSGVNERHAYDVLPGSRQWSPGSHGTVSKENWKPCRGCGRPMPVVRDCVLDEKGQPQDAGTWTGVCPFCGQCQVGTVTWFPGLKRQQNCHECGASLGESYQCPQCSYPRGWMRVTCPHCQKPHPVLAPHWVDMCDTFYLECAHCERPYISLCIC